MKDLKALKALRASRHQGIRGEAVVLRGWLVVAALVAILGSGCTQEQEAGRPGLRAEGAPAAARQATATPVPARAQEAMYFLQVGKRELELGAYYAAIAAFEAALELEASNTEARRGLEQARRAAAEATPLATPIATPTPLVLLPRVTGPSLQPPVAPPFLPGPTSTPTPTGCQGDEKITFQPAVAFVGERVTVSVISLKRHLNVRLAAPGPAEFLGLTEGPTGYLWQWALVPARGGDPSYFFYVDFNALCAFETLPTAGRWQPLSSGLPSSGEFTITALQASPNFPFDKTLFVGFDGKGVYKSADADVDHPTFTVVNQGLTHLGVLSLALSPNYGRDLTLFVGTRGGLVFRSTDGGTSWTPLVLPSGVKSDITALAPSPNFATDSTVLAASEGEGVLISPDRGQSWLFLNEGLTDKVVQALALSADFANDKTVFAGGKFSGSYRFGTAAAETGAGGTPTAVQVLRWSSMNAGLEDLWIRALAISPFFANDRTLFAGSAYGGLFKHDGKTWRKVNGGLGEQWLWVHSVVLSPRYPREATAYVGTRSGIYRTTSGGDTWAPMHVGLPDLGRNPDPDRGVRVLAISPDFGNDRTVFAGLWKDNLYRARD